MLGAGDQTIMDIAGHVSKQMLKHYSHIRMEAKRTALESIVERQTNIGSSGQQTGQAEGAPAKVPTWVAERSPAAIEQPLHGATYELCQSKKNGTAVLRIARE
jgi:hypothetical protein